MDRILTRQEASDAVGGDGWRYLLGSLRAQVPAASPADAAAMAARAVAACGEHADGHLRVDVRADRVVLALQTLDLGTVTTRDTDLARRITAAGLATAPGTPRPVQLVEIAIDALDIPAVRPFWKTILGYADESQSDGDTTAAIVDPLGEGPAVWFQRMDAPRPHRNRIHLDICVPHDEAAARIAAALAAGGRLLSDAAAPAFWVLADVEGNEACVTTWQGRDGVVSGGVEMRL
ncbi:VOC family protein [Luedemannella flava]|uniref:Putative pterin-4-alpha-carbinolamine dehydratase n=1 Tax=Luedemannella flava TaxID=349316 RepID=A0ABP4YV41_9ACTN